MKKCPACNAQCDDIKIYCSNCGTMLEIVSDEPIAKEDGEKENKPEKKERKRKAWILPVLLIVSVALNVGLGILVLNINEDVDYYSSRYSDISWNYRQIQDDYEFYDEYARIVPNDDSGKYHRYGCEELDSDENFLIYNVSAASGHASPCENCCVYD